MAELEEGKPWWDHKVKPEPGQFSFGVLRDFLGVRTKRMHEYAERLGIKLTPHVRNDTYLRKVYKRKLRFLTAEEAERFISHHRMVQGARLEARARKAERDDEP